MRKVFYTLDLTEAVLLKDRLLRHGVEAIVRNIGAVRVPHVGIASEVWVDDDAAGDDVVELIRGFLRRRQGSVAAAPSWRCPVCREDSPAEFESCWSCGHGRRAAARPGFPDGRSTV